MEISNHSLISTALAAELQQYAPALYPAMKPTVYILTLAIGFVSCNNKTAEQTADKNPVDTLPIVSAGNTIDTLQTVSAGKQPQNIYIKDNSLYDVTFIKGLADYPEPIKLKDNYIITGLDTTYFPDDLGLHKATTFKARRDNYQYVLTVTRTSLTNLKYNFQLTGKNNNIVDTKSGTAILGSMFFLASEMDEDSETGTGYGSSEYSDKANDCRFSIRIGIGRDDNGKLRAMVDYWCKDKSRQTLNLDNCPTLRTE